MIRMEITYRLDQLEEVAQQIIENADYKVLLFKGEVGAGKTTLIQTLAKAVGVTERVSSPTFSLVNGYACDGGMLYHFDFYRIKEQEEALDLGFDEYLDTGKWICIEWAENISKYLPERYHTIVIEQNGESQRNLSIH